MEGLLAVGGIFLVCNIPTVVLGGIWFHYKNRRDFQDEIKKMNIQDLGDENMKLRSSKFARPADGRERRAALFWKPR